MTDYTKPFAGYNGSNSIGDYAWNTTSLKQIGQKEPNELGFYDLTGNASE